MLKAKKANCKTVTVIARYFVHRTGAVCCQIRNAEGKEYRVCIQANGRTSCVDAATGEKCKGCYKGTCYHITEALRIEAARTAKIADKTYKQAVDEKLDGCYESDPRIEVEEPDPWEGLDDDEKWTAYGVYLMSIGAA